MSIGSTCSGCGIEDKLYERGRCARCSLERRTRELLGNNQGHIRPELAGVHETIITAANPRTALNWLRSGAGAPILSDIANGVIALTHQALDEHPNRRAADYVRQMLVVHGALPARDEALARLERWIEDTLGGIDDDRTRRLVETYATWRILVGVRRRAERRRSTTTATRNAKNRITVTVRLLDFLAAHQLELSELRQSHLDQWLTTQPPLCYQVKDFLNWAATRKILPRLDVPTPTAGAGSTLDEQERWEIARRLLHDPTIGLGDRVAGSFVLLYAQQLTRIAVMTRRQITETGTHTFVRFGRDDILVPEPLAGLVRQHLATPPPHASIGAPPTSPWLFPGHLPGRPITPARLGDRLGLLGIDARAGRRAALTQLAVTVPAAVLADLLGLHITTAVQWVNNANGNWSRYAADISHTVPPVPVPNQSPPP